MPTEKVTKRQVAAILARNGYQPDPDQTHQSVLELTMLKQLGSAPDDFLLAFVDTTDQGSVCFSALPLGRIHVTSYDVILNPDPPRGEKDPTLAEEMDTAEDLVRQARWAIITHIGQVDIKTVPTNDSQAQHRNNAR